MLTERLFPSTAAVIAQGARVWGIAYSKAGMIKLLHRLGFEWRKPKGLPARTDVAAQEAFIADYEKPLGGLLPDEIVYRRCGASRVPEPARPWLGPAWAEHLAVRRGPRAAG